MINPLYGIRSFVMGDNSQNFLSNSFRYRKIIPLSDNVD